MKRIILIILALTLVVLSCKKKDDKITGPGGVVNTPEGNTPEGKKWAGSVGGRTFTGTSGQSLKFNSFGAFEPEYYTNTKDNGITYILMRTHSIAKGINEKKVVLESKDVEWDIDGPNVGKTNTDIDYVGYELDDRGLLYDTHEDTVEEIKFENMSVTAFDATEFTPGIKYWPNIEAGSIFVSKDHITLSIGWGDYDNNAGYHKQTNDITTYGYLRIGDKGRIDGGVYEGHQTSSEMPENITREEVITYAKRGNISEFINEQSYSYLGGKEYIYILYYKSEGGGEQPSYKIYNFEYDDANATNTIKYIAGDDSMYKMPIGTTLEYADKTTNP